MVFFALEICTKSKNLHWGVVQKLEDPYNNIFGRYEANSTNIFQLIGKNNKVLQQQQLLCIFPHISLFGNALDVSRRASARPLDPLESSLHALLLATLALQSLMC